MSPHSDDLNERHLIGHGDEDDGISLGSVLALAAVVILGVVIWWVWL